MTLYANRNDTELLGAIAAGDKGAMREIYERHASAVQQFLCARGAETVEAADLLHEAMIVVWHSADRFSGGSSPKTWIFSIAKNKLIDRQRRAGRVELADPDLSIADDSPDPFDQLASNHDVALVRECLSKLKPEHRSAIHLAFVEELPYPEIAKIEGVPLGTVKTRVFHAKRRLAEIVNERLGT